MDVRFYLSLFLRRLPYFLLLSLIGAAVGLTLARILPAVYLAEATLVVEGEQIPDALAASTVQTQAIEQLQIIQQRILTRDKLLEMANRLAIYPPPVNDASVQMNADEKVEDLRERIRIITTGGTAPRTGPAQATLVKVSFEADTAILSAAVTNEVVTMILNEDVAMRTGSARQTLDFFVQEVQRLDQDLATKSAAMLDFKQKNATALPDSLDFRRSQLAANQAQLLQLDRQEADLRDQRDRIVRLHEAAVAANLPDVQASPDQRQLQALNDQLAALLGVLSPENPKVLVLKAQIAALEKSLAGAAPQGDAGQVRPMSAYEMQLADLDGQMKSITLARTQVAAAMDKLSQSIDATAANAAALDTMERDYANLRSQYDQAVASKARAETGDMIEALAKGQKISVIEQAVVPREPTSPNRILIAALGIGGGIAAGILLIVLLEFMSSAIRRPAELTAALGITPLATLPYLRTVGQIRWRRARIALVLLLVLAAIPAGLWLVDTRIMPLDLLIERMLGQMGLASLVDDLPVRL